MALDFVSVNPSGELCENIKIDIRSHGKLFDRMPVGKYPLLERIRDYYVDAEYRAVELDELVLELSAMRDTVSAGKNEVLLQSMISLVQMAAELSCNVEAIAD